MNLKGLAHEDTYLHLEKGDQFDPAYKALNPQMVVPTLIDGEVRLFQSLAILEYLDEQYPAAPAGRCRLTRLVPRLRAHQHRRLAPAPRAAHPPLFDGRSEVAAGKDGRLGPALARRRVAGDGNAALGARGNREVLPRRSADARRYRSGHPGDAGENLRYRPRFLFAGHAHVRGVHGAAGFRRRRASAAARRGIEPAPQLSASRRRRYAAAPLRARILLCPRAADAAFARGDGG